MINIQVKPAAEGFLFKIDFTTGFYFGMKCLIIKIDNSFKIIETGGIVENNKWHLFKISEPILNVGIVDFNLFKKKKMGKNQIRKQSSQKRGNIIEIDPWDFGDVIELDAENSQYSPYSNPYFGPYIDPYFSPYINPYFGPYINPYFGPYIDPYFSPYIDPDFDPYINPYFGPYNDIPVDGM